MHTMWLLGGLGLGAGLMYLLDPQQGEARRDVVRGYVGEYGPRTGDFLGDTGRAVGRQAQAVFATTRKPFRHEPGRGERLLARRAAWDDHRDSPGRLCRIRGGPGLSVGKPGEL